MLDLIYSLLFILPAYVANSAPVLFSGKTPIDFNKKFFDGQPIFGKGKTWLGLFGGFFSGLLVSILQAKLLINSEFDLFASNIFIYLNLGFLLSTGTLIGDLAGSFIKRRLKIKRGKPSFLLDQLSFLVFALLFAYHGGFRYIFSIENILFLFSLTYIVHRLANSFAYSIKLKKVPW
ncbi:MAG: CDP-2,3-bis-(O-geranylgeranyl)-sn-glycerol synthase [Candidatus Micrarchaeota archaeon]|nr:CDP-2,3-bis-(O-geranylgeranyl)-sn-glycerol synthase [Candidatus Micrarchaeota archaeon]